MEEIELDRGESDWLAIGLTDSLSRVQRHLAAVQMTVRAWRPNIELNAAELCFHPGNQLARAEWLHHIVVGTDRQAAYPVPLLSTSSQENDRHAEVCLCAQLAAYLHAVHTRQHDVQHHQTGRALGVRRSGECLLPGRGGDHAVTLTHQVALNDFHDHGLVIDNENSGLDVCGSHDSEDTGNER